MLCQYCYQQQTWLLFLFLLHHPVQIQLFLKYKDLTAIPIDNSFKSNIVLVTSTQKKPDPAAVLFEKMLLSYDFYGV